MKAAELYQSVTNRIIRELEEGVPPWVKPWKNQSAGVSLMPFNAVSGRPYSGINVLLLWAAAEEKGYPTHGWMTFKQANDIGAHVRKGEKSCTVTFVSYVEDEEDGTKYPILKTYSVFNIAQIKNIPAKYTELPLVSSQEALRENAKVLMQSSGVSTVHGGNKAAYYPARDEIAMPHLAQFESEDAYWGTAFHELTHASGHPSRLNRVKGKRFGDKAYAFEELVAELGSAFLCAHIGIPATFRSAAYLQSWLDVLKQDSRAIFMASSYASHGASFFWEKAFYEQNELTPSCEIAAEAAP